MPPARREVGISCSRTKTCARTVQPPHAAPHLFEQPGPASSPQLRLLHPSSAPPDACHYAGPLSPVVTRPLATESPIPAPRSFSLPARTSSQGLFHMLADPNKEIRAQCFHVLQEFLREICGAPDVSYAPIVHVLVQHASSQDKFSRLTAITWLHTLVSHGREKLLPFCAQCLNAILASLAHPEDEIKEAANRADGTLRSLVQSASDAHYEMHTVIGALSAHLASQHVGTLVATLGWVHMLLRKSASRVMQLSSQIWPALLKCLSNASEEVCRLDIEAIAYMASSTQQHFAPFIDHLLKLFREDRGLLEARGTVIVRQLCDLLERLMASSASPRHHQEDDPDRWSTYSRSSYSRPAGSCECC